MLISIRGTNGSGKSTIIFGLLDLAPYRQHYGVLGPRMPEALELQLVGVSKPVFVLGSYHVSSGGCDQVQPYDLILDLIRKYAAKGHVLFEGVLVSSSYGRVGRLMEEWGQEAVMAFMDTPLEQCIENVQKRRDGRGDARPFNPHNLTTKYNQIAKSIDKIAAEGKLRVVRLQFGKGLEQVLELLRSAE